MCTAFRAVFVIACGDTLDDLGALGDGHAEIGDLALVHQTFHTRTARLAIVRTVVGVLALFTLAVSTFRTGFKAAIGVAALKQ